MTGSLSSAMNVASYEWLQDRLERNVSCFVVEEILCMQEQVAAYLLGKTVL